MSLHKRQVDQTRPLISEMLAAASEGAIVVASDVVETTPPLVHDGGLLSQFFRDKMNDSAVSCKIMKGVKGGRRI